MEAATELQPNTLLAGAGLVTRDELQEQIPGKPSRRTIQRWEEQGLPVIRRGRLRLYDITAVRAWLRGERPARKRPA